MSAYFRRPSVCGKKVVFVSEDDLWSVPLTGGKAERLTSNLSAISVPILSPDGKWIAFVSREEGVPEIYVMPSEGGEARRLTWQGAYCWPVCWDKGEIVFASTYGGFNMREMYLFRIGLDGAPPQRINCGPALSISFGAKGTVLGRNTGDPARWKRYRGGTAGYLMIDQKGNGEFTRFLDLNSNIGSPMWIKDRVYFISDHEGIGNIYSAKTNGKDLKKHSNHKEYYARYAQTDGSSIIWQSGAEIYYLDLAKDKVNKLKIDYRSPRIHRCRKYVEATKYLGSFDLSPDASSLCMDVRGKAFAFGAWEGSVQQYGEKHGVRYSHLSILPEDKGLLMVSDEGDKEHFEIHPPKKDFVDSTPKASVRVLKKHDYGRTYGYLLSPCAKYLAYSNHRNELCLLGLDKEDLTVIDQNKHGLIEYFSWSADSRWIAYATDSTRLCTLIKIYDTKEKISRIVTTPVKHDVSPCFDPEGKFLYLVSTRTFTPTIDTIQLNFSFLNCTKPYLIPLRKDIRSPFIPELKAFEPKTTEENKADKKNKDEANPIKAVEIDFDGIADRIIEFPLEASNYTGLFATQNRLFYVKYDVTRLFSGEHENKGFELYYYDFEKQEEQLFQAGVMYYATSLDKSAIAMFIDKKVRIVSTKRDGKSELPKESNASRITGWVDLDRVKVEIEPLAEWKQMFREAWRLQKYFFWTEDMSQIDWQKIYNRYYPLVERVSSRSEFSDLMWEMQGELGTSHCYEFGGDYKPSPQYSFGRLGVDWDYDHKKQQWKIRHIVKGDFWQTKNRSPLMYPGLNIPEGSILKAINGTTLTSELTPERLLVNLANQPVQLTICDANGRKSRVVTTITMTNEYAARYRDWVEANRKYVHEKSDGKAGYIHIPDMSIDGLKEFHRYFLTELDYEALVVDVRYNGGGFVSQHLLEKLSRKRIGYDQTRWFGHDPYPSHSPAGAVVCLTNEHAGSDGDIFSHAFKLMKLGKLVGKRTWGGVIGIWPRNWLVDGTVTSQPEFSYWFKDVGWGVENYGTDPDIEVDILPQDYAQGKDPQLDKALEVVLQELEANPPLKPDFSNRPNLGI